MKPNFHERALAEAIGNPEGEGGHDVLMTLITVEEACNIYWLNRKTVIRHILKGNFNARKVGGFYRGIWLIEEASIDRYYAAKRKKTLLAGLTKKT